MAVTTTATIPTMNNAKLTNRSMVVEITCLMVLVPFFFGCLYAQNLRSVGSQLRFLRNYIIAAFIVRRSFLSVDTNGSPAQMEPYVHLRYLQGICPRVDRTSAPRADDWPAHSQTIHRRGT